MLNYTSEYTKWNYQLKLFFISSSAVHWLYLGKFGILPQQGQDTDSSLVILRCDHTSSFWYEANLLLGLDII